MQTWQYELQFFESLAQFASLGSQQAWSLFGPSLHVHEPFTHAELLVQVCEEPLEPLPDALPLLLLALCPPSSLPPLLPPPPPPPPPLLLPLQPSNAVAAANPTVTNAPTNPPTRIDVLPVHASLSPAKMGTSSNRRALLRLS